MPPLDAGRSSTVVAQIANVKVRPYTEPGSHGERAEICIDNQIIHTSMQTARHLRDTLTLSFNAPRNLTEYIKKLEQEIEDYQEQDKQRQVHLG